MLNKLDKYYKDLEDKNNYDLKYKIDNFISDIKSEYESYNKIISLLNSEISILSNQQINDQMIMMPLPSFNQPNN